MATDVSSAHVDQNNNLDDAVDDDWCEDGSDASELNRERKARENEFHKMGYRDGIIAGREASAQEGFNVGFKQAVLVGYNWGMVRGVTGMLAGLPACLKDKLAATIENKGRLGGLHESVKSISTDDALKLFHEDMLLNGSKQPHDHPEENCSIEVLANEAAVFGQLGNYFRELESILCEFPDIKFHFEERRVERKS